MYDPATPRPLAPSLEQLPRVGDSAEVAALFRRAKCLFLDCDGVIFDSNAFKIEAMRRTLADYAPAQVAQMERFWRDNGGVSRFVKFAHFFTHIAPRFDVETAMTAAAARFGQLSRAAYDGVEPVPAALHFARAAGKARCHVVSGAAQVELESVFAAKSIDQHFASILGSPRTKLELVTGVMAEQRCRPSEALLIGDGSMDYRVSQELGMHFIFLAEFSEWNGAAATLAGAPAISVAHTWADLLEAFQID
jgi:phosphoglycolate phosphatase-like HAD superfamily hydrolase